VLWARAAGGGEEEKGEKASAIRGKRSGEVLGKVEGGGTGLIPSCRRDMKRT